MPKVEVHIEINRNVNDVFQYLAQLENMCHWQKEISDGEMLTEGDLAVGSRFFRRVSFLGVRLEEFYKVSQLEENSIIKLTTYKSAFPFLLIFRTEEITQNQTKVTIEVEGNPRYHFIKFAMPILIAITRKAMQNGIKDLKKILEPINVQ